MCACGILDFPDWGLNLEPLEWSARESLSLNHQKVLALGFYIWARVIIEASSFKMYFPSAFSASHLGETR